MPRPIKNNADYFPHDADMRNDTRIKALRRKFGIEGYGIYCMLIELLTDSDFFQFKNDSLSIELLSGDFDIDPEKLTAILQYLAQLDLIQIATETNVITCKSLDKRMEALLSKRKRDRDGVFAGENTQSKVKESKVKESIVLMPQQKNEKTDVSDWEQWGNLIVADNDAQWHAMRGRKISRQEMDIFLSVAVRCGWTMTTQSAFRISLKGFKAKDHEKEAAPVVYTKGRAFGEGQ